MNFNTGLYNLIKPFAPLGGCTNYSRTPPCAIGCVSSCTYTASSLVIFPCQADHIQMRAEKGVFVTAAGNMEDAMWWACTACVVDWNMRARKNSTWRCQAMFLTTMYPSILGVLPNEVLAIIYEYLWYPPLVIIEFEQKVHINKKTEMS